MSNNNSFSQEEHEFSSNSKKVFIVGSNATINAVVNTGSATDPHIFIGLVTVGNIVSTTFSGNVTLDPGSKTQVIGNMTLSDSKGFIGLVTVGNVVSTTFAGNVTLDAGSKTGLVGNLTLSDSKGFIGLVTAQQGTSPWVSSIIGNVSISSQVAWTDPKTYIGLVTVANTVPVTFTGNVTLDAGSKTGLVGNVTIDSIANPIALKGNVSISSNIAWPDPKTYIGLATVNNATAWPDPKTYVGLMTIDIGTNNSVALKGNVTLSDAKTTIGLVTLAGGTAWTDPKTYIGLTTTVNAQAWPDPKTFIGLVTAVNGQSWPDPKGYIGLVTITGSLSAAAGNVTLDKGSLTGIIGNVTLTDPKTFIGSVSIGGIVDSKGYIGLVTVTLVGLSSTYTSLASIVSASGLATILVPPSGKIAVIKDLFLSSLGRSEVSLWVVNSSATGIRMPWTGLATTGGYGMSFGDSGLNVGKADDGLTIALNGAATVSWMTNVKFI